MNWLLIGVIIVILFGVIHGYHKGFLRIAYSLVAWVLMFVFVSWITPYINDFLMDNTKIYSTIEEKCEQQLRDKTQQQVEAEVENTGNQANESSLSNLGVSLPDSVSEKLYEKTAGVAGELLDQSGIYQGVAQGMAEFILNGISFFLALALAVLISNIIERFLNLVSKIPILGGINRFLGVFAGLVYGMFIVWLAFYLIALCCSSEIGRLLYSYIQESSFLMLLYENNPIVTLILYFF